MSSQQCCWRFKCAGMWHCLPGEQFWCGLVPSSSKANILRRMLVSWTQWHWRWHYDPSNNGYFSSKSTMSHRKLLESSTELTLLIQFSFTSLMFNKRKFNRRQQTQILKKKTNFFHIFSILRFATHLHLTVSTFFKAEVEARMLTR